ncbi:hypothetical protein X798_01699 [Onchocerca flexuosa]|uniref:Uncharacterized protein n=1 Tax=Onchocerca flexuosa TaxID=387005 RepID=A0A238C1F6_9BILA|nr:hypothetical protein X798_01699 [Onchocerca flexuosa]
MSKLMLQTIGIYFLPLFLSIAINYSTATVLNRYHYLDDNGVMDDNGSPQLFFDKSALEIAKKQMNERTINSLLRNAWIG